MTAPFILESYTFLECVGYGAYSEVWKCKMENNPQIYACKLMELTSLTDYRNYRRFKREMEGNIRITHPGIARIIDLIADDKWVGVVLEFCVYGDLNSLMAVQQVLPVETAMMYFVQVLESLAYIHRINISHRDIKLNNILIDENNRAKLCDFGLCSTDSGAINTVCGTVPYMAPELVRNSEYSGPSVDIWSLGICLYYMITGHYPWMTAGNTQGDVNEDELTSQIVSGQIIYEPGFPVIVKDLLSKMLVVDPIYRATAEELLDDEFVTAFRGENTTEAERYEETAFVVPEELIQKVELFCKNWESANGFDAAI